MCRKEIGRYFTHMHAYENLWSDRKSLECLIEKTESLLHNIEYKQELVQCIYRRMILTCYLYSGFDTQVGESINCYLDYTWKMLLANRLRLFGIFCKAIFHALLAYLLCVL